MIAVPGGVPVAQDAGQARLADQRRRRGPAGRPAACPGNSPSRNRPAAPAISQWPDGVSLPRERLDAAAPGAAGRPGGGRARAASGRSTASAGEPEAERGEVRQAQRAVAQARPVARAPPRRPRRCGRACRRRHRRRRRHPARRRCRRNRGRSGARAPSTPRRPRRPAAGLEPEGGGEQGPRVVGLRRARRSRSAGPSSTTLPSCITMT